MKKRINPPALEKRYIEFLNQYGIPIPSRKPLSNLDNSRIINEIIVGSKQEGDAGELLSKIIVENSRYKKTRNKDHHSSFNEQIQGLCDELQRGLDYMQISLPMSVFVGEFPTGSLNAQVLPIEDGALALINTGVFDFLWRITKLQALCVQKHDPVTGEFWPKNRLDQSKAIAIFANCLQCYLCHDTTVTSDHIPLAGGLRSFMQVNLCRECERFVIAHEIAHVANGDLKAGMTCIRETQCGEIRLFNKHHRQELAADLLATQLLLHLIPLDLPPKAGDNYALKYMKASSAAIAPMLFFTIDSVIMFAAEMLFDNNTTPPITDHPRSEERMERIRNELIDLELGQSFLDDIDVTVEWIGSTGREAVERIYRRC